MTLLHACTSVIDERWRTLAHCRTDGFSGSGAGPSFRGLTKARDWCPGTLGAFRFAGSGRSEDQNADQAPLPLQ